MRVRHLVSVASKLDVPRKILIFLLDISTNLVIKLRKPKFYGLFLLT